MKLKALIAVAVAAAFAAPLAQAGGDKAGAEAMFKSMDRNKDGFVSRDEAKGTPHDKDFAKLDKDGDGKLSREEHAAAPEHAGDRAATGATTDDTGKASKSNSNTEGRAKP